jgi:hypothetical protein
MNIKFLKTLALASAGSLIVIGAAGAQSRPMTAQAIQQRYQIHETYDGTMLHPDGHRSTAVPVELEDGRTGELVIPSDRRDAHPAYYRDDQTGDLHPLRMDSHATREQMVQSPRALRFQPEPQHAQKPSWERDALIIGGGAGAGALIGAAAGGSRGATAGAVAGGIGGLIYDLLSQDKRPERRP